MKFLKRICSSLNRFLSPQPGKNGSSMAFVMIIGAVLVIWVLAIMPLMVAVGNNSLTLQGSYADYLQSRSAIEFCKGELEKMVESKPPYTFCVVQNADGTYTPIPKMESGSLVTAYDTAVNRDPDSTGNIVDDTDTDDIPMESADGKKIVAICAVAQDTQEDNVYHITITTYNNGTKNLTYTADYTIRGSLLINPESYKQTQALPLSDFVLVDGKLGNKIVWNSNIRDLANKNFGDVTNLSKVEESLLSYDPLRIPGGGDADSGEYPAVFKVPVLPAIDPTGGSGNTSNAPLTSNDWISLNPVKKGEASNKGDVWYEIKKESYGNYNYDAIKVYLYTDSNPSTDITASCNIYLNGIQRNNGILPTSGIYTVSIDMTGYGKFLPVKGLQMLDLYDKSGSGGIISEYINDLDDLVVGQKYLLLNSKNYAMYHQNDGSLKSKQININQVQPNEYYWTLEKDGTDYYLKASNGYYLKITKDSVYLDDDKTSLKISDNGDSLTVWRNASNKKRYLLIGYGNIQKSNYTQNIYFCKQSTATVESSYSFVYGTSKDTIKSKISASDLKVNGTWIDSATLNAGTYLLTGKVSGEEKNLGKLIIEKATSLSADTISLSFTVDEDDPQKITVSASGIDEYGGVCYIGYAVKNSVNYHWFPADNGSYTFRLDYGHYDLAVCDSGTLNHENAIKTLGYHLEKHDDGKTFVDGYQSSMMMGSSLYFMGRDNVKKSNETADNYSIDTKGNAIYLTTDLLILRHGIKGSGQVIVNPYTTGENEQNDTLLFVVNEFKNAKNETFQALHFYKIPAGTDINNLTGDAFDKLECKNLGSDSTEEIKQIQYWFRKGLYPEINLDVAYVDRNDSGNGDKYYTDEEETVTYRKPDNRQLSHIVSGETIGWTNNGTLINGGNKSGDDLNKEFVVCPYVQKMDDVSISYKANRILLTAKDHDGNCILTVPNTLTFTCRYFSLDATQVIQEASTANRNVVGSFKIADLGRDESLIEWICKLLSLTNYSSKTLQMDFERYTTVYGYSSQGTVIVAEHMPQINRFEATVDLFEAPKTLPLMATYSSSEIANLYKNSSGSNDAIKEVRTVDRYTTIKCQDAGCDHTNCVMEFGAWGHSGLNIFTNYLYIDSSINEIKITSLNSNIRISSQERGYKSEYLGYFGSYSPESYGGTIAYFAEDTKISGYNLFLIFPIPYSFTVKQGFYFIPSTDDGVSFYYLQDTKLGTVNNTQNLPWKIAPKDLSIYSVYIDPDTGALNKAYVDTGIFDNTAEGAGGFSGGNVG